ncbi:MAG: efflux RND transporter periplasmic adaptor subunit [Planctomycetales bacterium]|nr:efflux RND transporter periplasmic adaptor subunit [Planctomycetales bacterium]
MKWNISPQSWPKIRVAAGVIALLLAGLSYPLWWGPLSTWIDSTLATRRAGAVGGGPAEPQPISGGATDAVESLKLTPQARRNLGLTAEYLQPVELTTYWRSITVPAVVVAKPGRSQIFVASPLNGVVTHVHAVTGEAVVPGELLFEIRLTYEDLVDTQTQYLKTISELQVETREIARLEVATKSGAISGKALLDRRYAKEKLEALLRSQREALRLHGLSERQVDAIESEGKLLGDLQVVAPDIDRHGEEELRLSQNHYHPVSFGQLLDAPRAEPRPRRPLVIDQLQVHKGQAVVSGDTLCTLSDYSHLFIRGKAFEQDVAAIAAAVEQGWTVEAAFPTANGQTTIGGLKIAFVDNAIDPATRTLSMFVELPNEVLRDDENADGQRFITWKYRLGQRLEIRVPVEKWENQIVLPVDAVVKQGAEWFVFQANGQRFDRIPVHVQHRDQHSVVIANDGSIFAGDVIAHRSAHQMQMAIKNRSGGAVDPHAGHSH